MINEELKRKIAKLAIVRKKSGYTQKDIYLITGVSRSHIANFERGIVNNAYLFDFYNTKFGGVDNGEEAKQS